MYYNESASCIIQIKKNHADLDVEGYGINVISYLDNARSKKL